MRTSKDIKDTVDNAGAQADQASELWREAESAHAAAGKPVDLTDPLWHPIDGVTLDKYARLTAALARQDLGTRDETQAWLEAHGVKPGTWAVVQTGWVNRMSTSEAVRTRYGILYSQS